MKKIVTIVTVLFSICFLAAETDVVEGLGAEFWDGDYFVHNTVKAQNIADMQISAKVDGQWDNYTMVELPESFLNWNFQARIKSIEDIKTGQRPALNGPHNAVVATYGYKRNDSRYALNNAVKGCGFLPKPEKLPEVIKKLEDTYENDFMIKLDVLTDLYTNYADYFDLTKQVSLELYATPERGTQTFLNQMENPASVLVFLDIPTFKLKTITYLIHPGNPNLSDYDKNILKYINLIHSYFHGEFSKEFIAVVYNITEVYNSSPGNDNGRGTLIVP